MDIIQVIVTAVPNLLSAVATIIVRAVPDMGGLPLMMVGSGFFLLFMAWYFDYV